MEEGEEERRKGRKGGEERRGEERRGGREGKEEKRGEERRGEECFIWCSMFIKLKLTKISPSKNPCYIHYIQYVMFVQGDIYLSVAAEVVVAMVILA